MVKNPYRPWAFTPAAPPDAPDREHRKAFLCNLHRDMTTGRIKQEEGEAIVTLLAMGMSQRIVGDHSDAPVP